MRKLAISLTLLAFVAAPPAVGAPPKVRVDDNFFKPQKVKIRQGGKVVWRWTGSNPHNVAVMKRGSTRKVKRRSAVKTEGRFAHRFRRAGRWPVICEIHPTTMRMRVVVVKRS